ncbi:PIH1 domain-containing protein 1 isoform X1 [Penaeus vannamei]|uniref:PIH1 domain-containing protein 1 isoform X1 n=1 Tax=Penaeus vannamei TaxID=6689 RepID=UPI00387F6E5B
MDKQQKSGSLLEIDDNIIRKQLLLEGDVPKELDSLFPASSASQRTETIKPKPGICVKTRNEDKKKVFINVCTSEAIPAPEDITDQELIAILESDKPSDFRVPMSIGQLHEEKDKSGEVCLAYDVVISPAFFTKMTDNPLFHNFFMIATMEGIEEKYTMTLDKNGWTVLKNKKYHGTVPEQTVRTSVPLVQELSGVRHWKPEDVKPATRSFSPKVVPEKPLITELSSKAIEDSSKDKRKMVPKYTLRKTGDELKKSLEAEVSLPKMISGKGLQLDVGEDRLVVETSENLLDVFLPFSLDSDSARAYFITSKRMLLVRVPILHA